MHIYYSVRSVGSRSGEWIACVPLIIYTIISIHKQQNVTKRDLQIVALFTLAMVMTCLLQLHSSYGGSVVTIIIGLLSFSYGTYLMFTKHNNYQIALGEDVPRLPILIKEKKQTSIAHKNLSNIIMRLMVPFPVLYFLSLSKAVNHDVIEFLFIIANVLTKLFFAALTVDVHVDLAHHLQRFKEEKMAEAKRVFLRYIMHHIRVPLNSLSMGLELMANFMGRRRFDGEERRNEEYSEEDFAFIRSAGEHQESISHGDTYEMMKEAASSMISTLDHVMSIQQIEEGMFQLQFAIFSIRSLLQRVFHQFKTTIRARVITIELEVEEGMPTHFIGDGPQIEHALSVLVSNAIKFSQNDSKIIVKISCLISADSSTIFRDGNSSRRAMTDSSVGEFATLTFLVRDFGCGISTADLHELFVPFVHLQQGDHSKGSGVSLYVCKQVIERHGGTIACESDLGQGSSFAFTLPLRISSTDKKSPDFSDRITAADVLNDSSSHPRSRQQSSNPLANTLSVRISDGIEVILPDESPKLDNALVVDGMNMNIHLIFLFFCYSFFMHSLGCRRHVLSEVFDGSAAARRHRQRRGEGRTRSR